MSGKLAAFAQLVCGFRDLVWLVMVVNVALIVLSGFSAGVGGLDAAAEVVLAVSVAINAASLAAAVGVLCLCRWFDSTL